MRDVQRRDAPVRIQIKGMEVAGTAAAAAVAQRSDQPHTIVRCLTEGVRDLSLDVSRKSLLHLRLQSVVTGTCGIGVQQDVAQKSPGGILRRGCAAATDVYFRQKIARAITRVSDVQRPVPR